MPEPSSDQLSLVEREHAARLHEQFGYRPAHCRGCWGDQASPPPPAEPILPATPPPPRPPRSGPLPARSTNGTTISLGEAFARLQARGLSFSRRPATTGDGAPEREQPEPTDPPSCATCGGRRWLRRDVPVGHPDFGRALACQSCNRPALLGQALAALLERAQVPPLYRNCTFANFPLTEGSQPGFGEVKAWWDTLITEPEHARPGLYLFGDSGVGKTSLAASIANAWSSWQAELTIGTYADAAAAVWISEPELLDAIRGTFSRTAKNTAEQIKHAVSAAPLLIIDELGGAQYTMWVAEQLLTILDNRYNSRLPTVITTNCTIFELEYLLVTMASRADRDDDQAVAMARKRAKRLLWRILGMSQRIELLGENLRDDEVRARLGLGALGAQLPLLLPSHHTPREEPEPDEDGQPPDDARLEADDDEPQPFL
jgi:DNA replication protein DnaC